MVFFKRFKIPILLFVLVLSISSLSLYNYQTQKNLLLEQMKNDADDIVGSITAAIKRFQDIKSTMNIQKLISDISLGLEIFEFRYLEPDGSIKNSMFPDEIGKIHDTKSFRQVMQGDIPLKSFFFETRDYVKVMAIYYPIFSHDKLIGMIDLSVDISEYEQVMRSKNDFTLLRRKVDVLNLLKAIESSILNSLKIFEETDMYDFLHAYIRSAPHTMLISLVFDNNKISISDNTKLVEQAIDYINDASSQLIEIDGQPIYKIVASNIEIEDDIKSRLVLFIDASSYVKNEKKLFITALITSAIALFFALFIARGIYFSAIAQSRSEKERLERLVKERTHEIELLSKIDALTGLWNRGYLEEMLEMEFKRAKRYEHDITLMIIDLDHFKRVNDTYGHLAGDEVLRQISGRIMSTIRETDFVGRYGGEEILVILPETSLEIAQEIAQTILLNVSKDPVQFSSISIEVTASIGISALTLEHDDYKTLFSQADEALYHAKEQGRNRIIVFND